MECEWGGGGGGERERDRSFLFFGFFFLLLFLFLYILLSVWFAWCQVFISGKLIHACYIHWCSIVEVAVDMLRVPSLWLLLGCVRIVILYSLFLD